MSLKKYILFIAFLIATTVSVHLIAYAQVGSDGPGTGKATGTGPTTGPSTGGGSIGSGGSGGAGAIPAGFTKGSCPQKEHNEKTEFGKIKSESSQVGSTDCTDLNPIGEGKLCDNAFRKKIIDHIKSGPGQSRKCITKTKENLESPSIIKLKEIDAPTMTVKVKVLDAAGKDTGKTQNKEIADPAYCGDLQVICSPEDIGGKKHTMVGTESSTKVIAEQNRIDQITEYKIYKTKYKEKVDGKETGEKDCVPVPAKQQKCP